jgi:ribonucleoside-diphosphate reductase alpha chain
VGSATFAGAPHVNRENLKLRGFTDEVLDTVEESLPTAFDINYVFNRYVIGESFLLNQLKIPKRFLSDPILTCCSTSVSLQSR